MKLRYIEAAKSVQEAQKLQSRRGMELLAAALAYYHGELGEQDFIGCVCRYGAAATEAQLAQSHANDIRTVNLGV